MSSILVEIITQLLGDAVASRIPGPQSPPEGTFNGSFGAIAAFFGFVAFLFAIPAVLNSLRSLPLVLLLSFVVTGLASVGIYVGQRAPRVTTRNLALARFGYRVSMVALVASLLALLTAVMRVLA